MDKVYPTVERICGACEKPFQAAKSNVCRGNGKYCSATCARRGRGDKPRVKCKCQVCDKEFEEFASRVVAGKGKYCSRDCSDKAKEKKRLRRSCDNCGKNHMILPYKFVRPSFYCSKECQHEARRTGEFVTCPCGEVFYVAKERLDKGRRYCSFECSNEFLRGPNHHLYQHGLDRHDIRRGKEFSDRQKKQIIERDNYCCVQCRKDATEVDLQIDHIVPIFEGGEPTIENGQTLCVPCHKGKSAIEMARVNARQIEKVTT